MVPSFSFSFAAPLLRPAPEQPQPRTCVQQHVPLEQVVRPMLTTAEAAYYLNRKPQTLRIWACKDEGPIRPIRMHGRLGWPASEIRRYLGVAQPEAVASAH